MISYVGMFEKIAAGSVQKVDKNLEWADRAYIDNAAYTKKYKGGYVNLPTGELVEAKVNLKDGTAYKLQSPDNAKSTEKRHTVLAIGNSKKYPGRSFTTYDRPATKKETFAAHANTVGNIAALGGAAGTLAASSFIRKRKHRNRVGSLAALAGISGLITSAVANRYLTRSGEDAQHALRQVGVKPNAQGETSVKYHHYKKDGSNRIKRLITRKDESYNLHKEVFENRPRFEVTSLVNSKEH